MDSMFETAKVERKLLCSASISHNIVDIIIYHATNIRLY